MISVTKGRLKAVWHSKKNCLRMYQQFLAALFFVLLSRGTNSDKRHVACANNYDNLDQDGRRSVNCTNRTEARPSTLDRQHGARSTAWSTAWSPKSRRALFAYTIAPSDTWLLPSSSRTRFSGGPHPHCIE